MSIDEFLERLAGLKRLWTLESEPGMPQKRRIRSGCHCPISAVTGVPKDYGCAVDAGEEKLGLSRADARAIVHSSDAWNIGQNNFSPTLRSRLLKACGLPEEVS